MFDAVCISSHDGFRFYATSYDSIHSLTAFQLYIRYSGGVTIAGGQVRVHISNMNINFTPYLYLWFNYWVYYFTALDVSNMDYGCEITRQGWRISSWGIRYESINITPYLKFTIRNGYISINGDRGGNSYVTMHEFCKLLAASVVLSPRMDELIY